MKLSPACSSFSPSSQTKQIRDENPMLIGSMRHLSKLSTLSFIKQVYAYMKALLDFTKVKAKQFYLSIMYPLGVYRTKLSQTYLWSNILQSHHALQVMSLPYSMFKWSWNKWQNPSKLETLWHPDLI